MNTVPTFSSLISARLGGGWPMRAITSLLAKNDEDAVRAALEATSSALLHGATVTLIDVPAPDPPDRRHLPPALDKNLVLAALGAGSMALSLAFLAPRTPEETLAAIREHVGLKTLVVVMGFERFTAVPAADQRHTLRLVEKAPAASLFVMAPLYFEDGAKKIVRLVRTMSLNSVELTKDVMPWSCPG